MVSAVEFGFMRAMIANQNDLEAYVGNLRRDVDDLNFDKQRLHIFLDHYQALADALSSEKADLEQRVAELDRTVNAIVSDFAGEKVQADKLRVAVNILQRQLASTKEELEKSKEFSRNVGFGYMLAHADAAGARAMLDLVRSSPERTDLDQPGDDVAAPQGHTDSPLQSAYRIAYARRLMKVGMDRATLEASQKSSAMDLPFPVADYIDWLSDPENSYDGATRRRKPGKFGSGSSVASLAQERLGTPVETGSVVGDSESVEDMEVVPGPR